MNKISDQIMLFRKSLNLSQVEFGKKIGVNRITVSRYEKGHLHDYTSVINKISDAFPGFNPSGLSIDLDFSKKGGHMVRTKDGYFLYLDVAGRLCRVSEENSDIVEVNLKGEWVPAKAP